MKQITMSTFGNNGRLGNQLFQYASLLGLAAKFGARLQLPPWPYAKYFEGVFPEQPPEEDIAEWQKPNCIAVKEQTFGYVENWPPIKENDSVDIWGYLQSYKYWETPEAFEKLDKALSFKDEVIKSTLATFKDFDNEKRPIAISIRRGDYVGNSNYAQLGVIGYYYLALNQNFPDWRERQIIIFSDDIPYCRVHFGGLGNVVFSENNSDIEDICLMSCCHDFVIGNSTFAFWGAYLGSYDSPATKVVRPVRHFDGLLKRQNDIKDYYPPDWIPFDDRDHTTATKRIEATDVCFTIPVFNDHPDRLENLALCINMLKKNFNCSIIVMEQYLSDHRNEEEKDVEFLFSNMYLGFKNPYFHRTKMLNDMAKYAYKKLNCNIIFNWDADVFIPPLQILESIQALRSNKADMSFPYNWAFARMPRKTWFETIRNHEDIGMVKSTQFNGMTVGHDVRSVGGAVGFRYDAFVNGGMENENFISYGPEDVERVSRFEKLGFKIHRTVGPNLYHMNHWCGPNSDRSHAHFVSNQKEVERIQKMSVPDLEEEIVTWSWVKNALEK